LDILQVQKNTKWHDKWKDQVVYMLDDKDNAVRAAAFDVLGDWKIKSAKQLMIANVNDSSYNVASSALAALYKIDEDTAYLIAKQLLSTKPGGDLELVIWSTIGRKGYENDIDFFEQKASYVYGTRQFSFVSSLYYYMQAVKSDVAFEKGAALIAKLTMKEPIKTYRPALASYLYRMAQSYDGKAKTDSKEDAAEDAKRIAILKAYIERIVAAEKDPDNLKTYKSMKTTANALIE
ncbi:MAG: HEAT repeat domain-containing protein, partial [Flavipsychrobacter sp.]